MRAWCSEACKEDAAIRAGWSSWVRGAVWRRDHGVCAECGADAARAAAVERYFERCHAATWRERDEVNAARALLYRAWQLNGAPAFWEADHVVPVAEGGGGCGLDGYRTLCRPCHLEATRALRRRMAERRRLARTSSLTAEPARAYPSPDDDPRGAA